MNSASTGQKIHKIQKWKVGPLPTLAPAPSSPPGRRRCALNGLSAVAEPGGVSRSTRQRPGLPSYVFRPAERCSVSPPTIYSTLSASYLLVCVCLHPGHYRRRRPA